MSNIKQTLKPGCISRANYALEEWAKWILSNNGYPSTSAIEQVGKTSVRGADAPLPHGVELPNREVANVIYVFHKMIDSDSKSANNCHILRFVLLTREGNESLRDFCKRVQGKIFPHQYYSAVREFAARLDMI